MAWDSSHVPRYDDSAALAANWRTVVLADAALGVIGLLGAVFTLLFINVVVGAIASALVIAYLALVTQRARRWRRLRQEAGL